MTDPATVIRQLEDERFAAMLAGDTATLDRLLSADLVYTHSNGTRDTKASYLQRVRDGFFVYESIEHPIESILILDSVAVVVGGINLTAFLDGRPLAVDCTCLTVWALEGGDWRVVAYQPTVVTA